VKQAIQKLRPVFAIVILLLVVFLFWEAKGRALVVYDGKQIAPNPATGTDAKWEADPKYSVAMGDFELIKNATFSGVTRANEKLHLTYKLSAEEKGKRPCPT
jgi:hypothetical protein